MCDKCGNEECDGNFGYIAPLDNSYFGHFHVDRNQDRLPQIEENLKMIMTQLKENDEWDQPPEVWFINERAEQEEPHQEKWSDCPLNTDPDLLCWDPYRLFTFGGVHPAQMFAVLPNAPRDTAIVLFTETWFLDSGSLEEEERQAWKDGPPEGMSIADHPKAVECKNLVYCSKHGEIIMCTFSRGEQEINSYREDQEEDGYKMDGAVAKAMRRFVSAKDETWSSTLKKLLQ